MEETEVPGEKPQTYHKSLDKRCIENTSPRVGFELTTFSGDRQADCISNYHTITITKALYLYTTVIPCLWYMYM